MLPSGNDTHEDDMPSTLQDYGRTSDKYGEIGFYYAFPIKFFFCQSMLEPDDVLTWCRENCKGYYKVISYTHKSSKRNAVDPTLYDKQVVYVDRIYLSDGDDAMLIKLSYDVQKTKILRPRIARRERRTRQN